MITLSKLRTLAKEYFPESGANFVVLLVTWAYSDPGGELSALLKGTGIQTNEMVAALEPLLTATAQEDEELMISCIMDLSEGPATGVDLLRSLSIRPEHRISRALLGAGLDLEKLKARLHELSQDRSGLLVRHRIKTVTRRTRPLFQYGRDLTALAEEGAFDELCDRPSEIDRILEVLLRRRKGNVALIGPAGVGKTALVELFARRLITDSVPEALTGTRIFELSMAKLVAGTQYRGDFEKRMEEVLKAIQDSQPAILFIDEMHLIWGAGRAAGVITDAANILKPFLSRGAIRVIGATTVEEYQQYIARDEALARRFQEIRLNEPDDAVVFDMAKAQARALAQYHKIRIAESEISQAIELTNRHLPNRWQPDKTVDLLDSASVRAIREGRKVLLENDLLNTIAKQTGRPVGVLSGKERISLQGLSDRLKKRIVGQDYAIERVANTLISRRQELGDPNRNLGTFLFAGDTGVGKTEMARSIAVVFYHNEKALLQIDLGDYSNPGSVNRLIGSPAGFVDSEKEGVLIAWLHNHCSGVILFDEIEKAHETVHSLLLGLLDTGRISSARGKTMDARQCVVVLTTNAIKRSDLQRYTIGFESSRAGLEPAEILSDHFPREFLARLDEIIPFNQLGDEEMRLVLKLRLDEALDRLAKKNITVVFDEQRLLSHLLLELKNIKTGARGIARMLETKLIHPISLAILPHEKKGRIQVELNGAFYENGKVTIAQKATH